MDDPTPEQVAAAARQLITDAVQPIAGSPKLRKKLVDVRRSYEQVIDTASADRVISGEYLPWRPQTGPGARPSHSASSSRTTRMRSPPCKCSTASPTEAVSPTPTSRNWPKPSSGHPTAGHRGLWQAYETLDASKVRGSGHRVNTDLVSLVRHALGHTDELVSYPELVNERFEAWLDQQQQIGRSFTDDQTAYLSLIKERLSTSLTVAPADLQNPPFSTHGGLGKARQLFGTDLNPLLAELTQALAA